MLILYVRFMPTKTFTDFSATYRIPQVDSHDSVIFAPYSGDKFFTVTLPDQNDAEIYFYNGMSMFGSPIEWPPEGVLTLESYRLNEWQTEELFGEAVLTLTLYSCAEMWPMVEIVSDEAEQEVRAWLLTEHGIDVLSAEEPITQAPIAEATASEAGQIQANDEPTAQPSPYIGQIKITSGANIRSNPGTGDNAKVVGKVAVGETYAVLSQDAATGWYQFVWQDGQEVWISAKMVEYTPAGK